MSTSAERRTWGVGTHLLVPVLALALLAIVALAVIADVAIRRHEEELVIKRGVAVRDEIVQRINERLRAKENFANLLANDLTLGAAIVRGDGVKAAQILLPLKSRLGLAHISVYDRYGKPLVILGPQGTTDVSRSLVLPALSGITLSVTSVEPSGLILLSGAPMKGRAGVLGAVVVGGVVDKAALAAERERVGVELALFHDGQLMVTTLEDSDLTEPLQRFDVVDVEASNRLLAPFAYQAAAPYALNWRDMLLPLVSLRELEQATRARNRVVLLSAVFFLTLLLIAGLVLTRQIIRPLASMVTVTQEMHQGNFSRRVVANPIRELDRLGGAINHLADTVQRQMAELTRRAFYDSLTKLPNRALFVERVKHALARARRHQKSVVVMFIDLDTFKVVNDSLGHQNGDQLLIAVSERIHSVLRPDDTIARLGGDEFTVLLEEVSGVGDAIAVAERIKVALHLPFSVDGREVFTSASIGIALGTADDSPENLLRDADLAMYKAKTSGRARHEVFEQEMSAWVMQRLELETQIRRAIERQEFELYYQPIVDLETSRLAEIEALVRWRHPVRGLVEPREFIPLAEETGMILPLGRWVLQEACRQAHVWHMAYPSDPPVTLSVNISARQLRQPGFIDEIKGVLEKTGLDPATLKLELTETAMMQNFEATIATLDGLKALGINLAIDDFGTGYSTLSYLKHFPVDTVKIDRAFVEEISQGSADVSIIRGIITFAKPRNLIVTAEGIETSQQAALLRTLGCDRAQGFHIARPLPSDEVSALLAASGQALVGASA